MIGHWLDQLDHWSVLISWLIVVAWGFYMGTKVPR